MDIQSFIDSVSNKNVKRLLENRLSQGCKLKAVLNDNPLVFNAKYVCSYGGYTVINFS